MIKIGSLLRTQSRISESRSRAFNGRVYRFEHRHHAKDGVTISCMIEVYRQWTNRAGQSGWNRCHRFTYQKGQ